MPTVGRRYASTEQRFSRPSGRADASGRAPVVLLVSGDADSTALLVLAATSALDIFDGRGEARIARERLHVLHVKQCERGMDAEEDEEFVSTLCMRFGVPCTVRVANRRGATAREVRYAAAAELANGLSAEVGTPRSAARILTAHTADDRAESFFVNALRGVRPAGLSFMARQRNRIVRPLLNYTHQDLCDLLRMRGIVWREGRGVSRERHLLNLVRAEAAPLGERADSRVVANLSAACEILSDEDAYLASVAGRMLRELTVRRGGDALVLDARKLCACEVAIARRVVRQAILLVRPAARMEPRHVDAVLRGVAAGRGVASVPAGIECRVEHGALFIQGRSSADALFAAWIEVPGSLRLSTGTLMRAQLSRVMAGADAVAIASAHNAEWAGESVLLDAVACGVDPSAGGRLWVEAPQVGDVVCPAGMHGQSELLTDALAGAGMAQKAWGSVAVVRSDADGRIVWVPGVCADERARVTPATRYLLELTVASGQRAW